ncbi:MAG: ATP-dependent RecD-like DNA helicase [Acholeplasmataceae bacterium]|nr:ATP-dependent RecD-like DNA helicase [Acholeplasmataceae bacterium]
MEITGYIIQKVFKNKENGYSIYKLSLEEGDVVTIVGYLPEMSEEVLFTFEVDEVTHPKFGLQYQVKSYQKAEKQNKIGLISYLSSDFFTGIGPVKASKIVNTFGDNAIEIILKDKSVLKEIGFNPLQIERFYQELYQHQLTDTTLVKLFGYGFSPRLSMKLFNRYKEQTLDVLDENPYRLIDEVEGIGFKRADEIAFKLGFSEDNPLRIEAAILFAFKEYIFSHGHTYLEENELSKAIYQILSSTIDNQLITDGIARLIEQKRIIQEDTFYYLKYVKKAEQSIATNLLKFETETIFDDKTIFDQISRIESILNITYTDKQKEAIIRSIKNPITVITGGPGTGKTTVLLGLLMTYSFLFGLNLESPSIVESIALAAPTGRSSRRMKEVMNVPAQTIHRLLGYDYDGTFHYDEVNQLTQKLYIIDEVSMVDIFLADQLFRAIPENAKVVLVGDKDQLPSVGPGQVLGDIIGSNRLEVIELKEIHRQANNSGIIELANRINNQIVDDYSYESTDDLFFMKMNEMDITNTLIALTDEAIKQGYDLIEDMQILIPKYKGAVGIDIVNALFQKHYQNETDIHLQNGSTRFYMNDKVIQLVNAPDKGVMNGDIGVVKDIYETTKKEKVMRVQFSDGIVQYEEMDLDELNLAYAISVHKSQGSEYKIVYMPLVRSYSMMLRKELLYTGVTRAKQYLYLLGELRLIEKASKVLNEKRKTKLKDYLNSDIPTKKELTPADFM